ncbi:NIF family HAD-type phosphatase [Achromobacter animicus]
MPDGTLISNAASQIPRPGLFEFLERCRELFPRIVMFTTVSEARFRAIAELLAQEHLAPAWFAQLEYVQWSGTTKDMTSVPDSEVTDCVLVDDFEDYVHPGQHSQWVSIECFAHPYLESDTGLIAAIKALERRVEGWDSP